MERPVNGPGSGAELRFEDWGVAAPRQPDDVKVMMFVVGDGVVSALTMHYRATTAAKRQVSVAVTSHGRRAAMPGWLPGWHHL